MTDREKIMVFFREYSKNHLNPNINIAAGLLSMLELDKELTSCDVVKYLFGVLNDYKTELEKHISINGKAPSIKISADTEEGKQLIKNLMEMYKKKEE